MKKNSIFAMLMLFVLLGMTGCGKSPVSMVKAGIMPGFPTKTIGTAFEAAFKDVTWQKMETEKKVTLVIFTGKLKERIRDNELFDLYVAPNSEFYMEFTINADGSFTPGYAKLKNPNNLFVNGKGTPQLVFEQKLTEVELNTTKLLTDFLQKIY